MIKVLRSMLFCPGSKPELVKKVAGYQPDSVILDLEDSVSYTEKISARENVCKVLKENLIEDIPVFVRVNALFTQFGSDDINAVVKSGARYIRLPMCETKEDVLILDKLLCELESTLFIEPNSIGVQCSIETPQGVMNALEIACACKRVISISFGTEDYTNKLGVNRTNDSRQFLYARSHIALCASIAGVFAIDSVYSAIRDTEGFLAEAKHVQGLGFAGKSCLHPAQISLAHEAFSPSDEDIENARNVIKAFEECAAKGMGVTVFNNKMIDKPIIEKAQKIIEKAKLL